jgi:hypothetical protein
MGDMVTIHDDARSRLRRILGEMQTQVTAAKAPEPLQTALTALVTELDLGAEPILRACPACGSMGAHNATLCGTCWAKLTPIS